MNRERRFSLCLCIAAMLIMTVAPVASAPTVTAHKWEDRKITSTYPDLGPRFLRGLHPPSLRDLRIL